MLPVRYTFWDVPFHTPRRSEVLQVFTHMLEEKKYHMVFTPNPEIMLVAEENSEYKKILQQAYWNMPDGYGLLWATTFLEESKNMGNKWNIIGCFLKTYGYLLWNRKALTYIIPETVTGSGTFSEVHTLFAERGTRVFYFGGSDDVVESIREVMTAKYPGVRAVGSCGGFPFHSTEENDEILKKIEKAAPEVLFVALNFPKQERWIFENKERLEAAGVKVAMGIGGALDFAVGKIKRAPEWMQKVHIEWLWRLLLQPVRAKRIMRAVLYFPWKVLEKRLAAQC